ncbi:MAG TPA: hypothetical protein VMD55_09015 [Terracidiphilus sp.]|nr:hypothetical protein [Terracidiphilus sp.]
MYSRALLTLFFTLPGFAVMGYHPGLEDDGVYLAAVKARLDSALFPHNAAFFRLQTQATVFDAGMAGFVRVTHMPLAWAELLWQLACLFAILFACHSIARRLFCDPQTQWAGVAVVAALFTLPVTGTALYLADQHLHPRNAAAALILLAVSRILAGRPRQAVPLLLAAALVHPLMAAFGVSFCAFLTLALLDSVHARVLSLHARVLSLSERPRIAWRGKAAALIPLAWLFQPANPAWVNALNTRIYCHLAQWTWYEWLGALAPLALFGLLWRATENNMIGRRGEKTLTRFALAVFAYGVFQQALAVALLAPSGWARLMPLQPMRYLQLVYFFLALVAGGLVGKHWLRGRTGSVSVSRWALFLVLMNGGMLTWQLASFRGSAHIELPGMRPANPWLQAFAWIRASTPKDAYFALDPWYLCAPGEDYHGFRALAERSSLADEVKDASVAMQVPELAPVWARQVAAEQGWAYFKLADFQRLKAEFGVDWVLVAYRQPAGLACAWHNRALAVCRIP